MAGSRCSSKCPVPAATCNPATVFATILECIDENGGDFTVTTTAGATVGTFANPTILDVGKCSLVIEDDAGAVTVIPYTQIAGVTIDAGNSDALDCFTDSL